jgi:hypothetical protein
VLRHYALLLRWRFSGETGALDRVGRSIVNYVTCNLVLKRLSAAQNHVLEVL